MQKIYSCPDCDYKSAKVGKYRQHRNTCLPPILRLQNKEDSGNKEALGLKSNSTVTPSLPPTSSEKEDTGESIVAKPDIFVDNAEEDNLSTVAPSIPKAAAPKKKRRRPPPALVPIEEIAEVR